MSVVAHTMSAVAVQSFPVEDYDLSATLASGQAFRWRRTESGWEGVIGRHWVRLRAAAGAIAAEALEPVGDWSWLREYLQLQVRMPEVLDALPKDEPMRAAVAACRGLRLLRQDPWECLASFILSSTKQILQIQQIIEQLSECYGEPVSTAADAGPARAFPTPARLAPVTESDLRACKMGFRAPYLLEAARRVDRGRLDLAALHDMQLEPARATLMQLAGVGQKIADCVLLFAYGFQLAFPVDVWVMKGLRQLYFPRRRVPPKRLRRFADKHFGAYAGYAQQYLFHYMRVKSRNADRDTRR